MSTKPKKPANEAKQKHIIREFVSVKHEYTQQELNEITRRMTTAVQHGTEQEEQLKAVSADFKAKIKTAKSVVNECTNQLVNGYEMRQQEAEVELDRKKGKKTIRFHAPGKPEHRRVIEVKSMTEQDYACLPLELPAQKSKEEKKGKKKAEKTNMVDAFANAELAQERGEENAAAGEAAEGKDPASAGEDESLIQQCIEVIRSEQKASVSLLQRRLRLGYARAARIMDEIEKRGIVGPTNGAEPREIIAAQ